MGRVWVGFWVTVRCVAMVKGASLHGRVRVRVRVRVMVTVR